MPLAGFGLDFGATAAQSSPFYNESGIYFNSPGAGGISDSPTSSEAVPRSKAVVPNAIADSTIPYGSFSNPPDNSILYYIIGAIALIGVAVFFVFRKS